MRDETRIFVSKRGAIKVKTYARWSVKNSDVNYVHNVGVICPLYFSSQKFPYIFTVVSSIRVVLTLSKNFRLRKLVKIPRL